SMRSSCVPRNKGTSFLDLRRNERVDVDAIDLDAMLLEWKSKPDDRAPVDEAAELEERAPVLRDLRRAVREIDRDDEVSMVVAGADEEAVVVERRGLHLDGHAKLLLHRAVGQRDEREIGVELVRIRGVPVDDRGSPVRR